MGKSSFIWGAYRNGATENDAHREAKLRIGNLLLARGWSVRYEKEIEITEDWHPVADIYAAHPDRPNTVVIELLGGSHKTTTRKWKKDASRTRAIIEKEIGYAEFEVEDINGRMYTQDDGSKHFFQVRDDEIMKTVEARAV